MREVTLQLLRYRVAIAATLVAFLIMLLLPARSERLPFAVFIGAVVVSAWHGGLRPGLAATILSALALIFKWFVLPAPPGELDTEFWPRLATFGFIGLLASYLSKMCQRAVEQVEWINSAFASIADAAIFTDTEGQVTYLNAAAEALTGWPLREADGKPLGRIFQVVHEETRQPAESAAARVLGTQVAVTPATRATLIGRTGAMRTIEQRASLLRDARGSAIGAILVFRDVTEAQRAERERERSEKDLHVLMASVPVGLIVLDRDGRCTYTNLACQRLCDFAFEEGLGEGWVRAVHSEDRAGLAAGWTEAARDGTPYEAEFRCQTAPGSFRWVRLCSVPLHAESGEVIGQVGTLVDISARRQAEEAVRKVQALLQDTLLERDRASKACQESQIQIQAVEAERDRAEAALRETRNQSQALGAERNRLEAALNESRDQVQTAFNEHKRLEDSARVSQARAQKAEEERDRFRAEAQQNQAQLQNAKAGQRQAEDALREARRDLEQLASRHAADIEQATEALQVQIQDHQQTAEALRENQARLQTIFDTTTAAVFLKDAEGRFLLVNQAFKNVFQLGKKHVVERTVQDLFPPELAETFRANDRQALTARSPLELEETIPSEHAPRTLLTLRVPIFDVTGKSIGLCGVAVDVSVYKRFELELRACEDRLRESREQARQGQQEAQATAERLREQLQFVRSITTSLGDGVCAVNRFGGLTFVNPAAERMLGWQESDLLGQDFRDTIHPPHSAEGYLTGGDGFLATVIEDRMTVRHEGEVFARKDGRPLPVACTAAPLFSEGEVGGAVFSFHEVAVQHIPETVTAPPTEVTLAEPAEPALVPAPAKLRPVLVESSDWLSYN